MRPEHGRFREFWESFRYYWVERRVLGLGQLSMWISLKLAYTRTKRLYALEVRRPLISYPNLYGEIDG